MLTVLMALAATASVPAAAFMGRRGPALLYRALPLRDRLAGAALALAVVRLLARPSRGRLRALVATGALLLPSRLIHPDRLFRAIDDPRALPVDAAGLADGAPVIGVEAGGEARAYVLGTVARHHLINDAVGGEPVLVSYCPLCRSGVAYDARLDERRALFRVAGLWRRNMLMRDLEHGSIWQQSTGEGLAGPDAGRQLGMLPAELTTWGAWRADHLETTVVVEPPSAGFDYRRGIPLEWGFGVFGGRINALFPGAAGVDRRLPGDEEVAGLVVGGEARAYPLARIDGVVNDVLGGRPIAVARDRAADRVRAFERPDGADLRWRDGGLEAPDGRRWDARGRPLTGGAAPLRALSAKRELWVSWSEFNPGSGIQGPAARAASGE